MIRGQVILTTMNGNNIKIPFVKNVFNVIVVLCGTTGLFFSIMGIWRFPNEKIVFIIILSGCLLGILIAILDICKIKRNIYGNSFRLILSILSGVVLVLASIFLLFFTNYPIFIKLVSVFSIIFFSFATIKGLVLLKTKMKSFKK